MSNVAGANIPLTGDSSGFVSSLNTARQKVGLFIRDMNSGVSNAYRKANENQRVFRSGLTKLGDDLTSIGGKMTVFGTMPALFAAGKAYKDFTDVQRLNKGLELYGQTLSDVRRLAKEPNVGVFDGAKALVGLRATRMEAGLAERAVKSFANAIAASGGNAADLEPALFNLKQFKSTQNINQVDLRQLANRIPQTMEVLEKAFGTTDVGKLNQLGIDKFIEGFVSQLEKLPKVTDLAASKTEQLGDSFTFFSATIGKGIETTAGVSSVFGKLADMLDDMSTNFESLNPEAQKAVIWAGGLAAAVPVVITTIGALVKLLPITAAGFAGISWPIVAALGLAAAIAGVVAILPLMNNNLAELNKQQDLVNSNTSKLAPLLKQYDELKGKTQLTKDEQVKLQDVTKQIADLVPSAVTGWDKYGKAIDVNTAKARRYTDEQKKLLAALQATRRETLLSDLWKNKSQEDRLRRELQSGKSIQRVDRGMGVWSDVETPLSAQDYAEKTRELLEITKRSQDSRKELLSLGGQGLYVAEANKLKQMQALREQYSKDYKKALDEDNLALIQSIGEKSRELDKDIREQRGKANQMILMWNQAKAEARGGSNSVSPAGETTKETKILPLNSLSVTQLEDKLKSLKEEYNNLDPTAADFKKRQVEIATEAGKVSRMIDNQSLSLKESTKRVKENTTEYKKLTAAEYEMWKIDLETRAARQQNELKEKLKDAKETLGVVAALNIELKKQSGYTLQPGVLPGLARAKAAGAAVVDSRIKTDLKNSQSPSADPDLKWYRDHIDKRSGESTEDYEKRLAAARDAAQQTGQQISASLRGAAADVGLSFAEMLGNLATGEGGLEDFGSRVVAILGSMLKEMGKALVGFGLTGKALEVFKDKPGLAFATGIAVTAIGQGLSNSVAKSAKRRFAKGGFAFNEMEAIIGDNPNSINDPEMVAPYSKVDKSIKKSVDEARMRQGSSVFIPDVKVRGQDLLITFRRAEEADKYLNVG